MDYREEAKVRFVLTNVGLGAILAGLTAVLSIAGGVAADPQARFDPGDLHATALVGLVFLIFGGVLMATSHLLGRMSSLCPGTR